MNARQKTKLKKLIVADCELRYSYTDGKGKYCVIGSMAAAAGVSAQELEEAGKATIVTCEWAGKVRQKFGLTMGELTLMQRINDATASIEVRRANLLAFLG